MRIGQLSVRYFSHVCFAFRSPGGVRLITDPFFGEGSAWRGHYERYLTPPDVPVSAIRACDALFISHIHGDHFDPDAVLSLQRRTGARIIAPADVLGALMARGVGKTPLLEARKGAEFAFGDTAVTTYAGYDGSFDDRGRPNKFSITIECGPGRLFYSGDCHQLPPAVLGQRVDAAFCWAHPDDERLTALCTGLDTDTFVLMHGDRFEPGDFFCNADLQGEAERIPRRHYLLLPSTSASAPVAWITHGPFSARRGHRRPRAGRRHGVEPLCRARSRVGP